MNEIEMNLPSGWAVFGPIESDDHLYVLRRDGVGLGGIRFHSTDAGGGRFSWFGLDAAGELRPWDEGGFQTIEKAAQMAVRILQDVPRTEAAGS